MPIDSLAPEGRQRNRRTTISSFMGHTYTNLLTHVIFSTKSRAPIITLELASRLHPYLGGIIRKMGGKPIAIGGAKDHVHLLIWKPADTSVSETLRVLKANSSRWNNQSGHSRTSFAWQEGYGAFSVSHSSAPAVVRYIRNQEEHHRRVSFQQEFVSFLKKHGIVYDERFIWD